MGLRGGGRDDRVTLQLSPKSRGPWAAGLDHKQAQRLRNVGITAPYICEFRGSRPRMEAPDL